MKKGIATILMAICLVLGCVCVLKIATHSEIAKQDQVQETFVVIENGRTYDIVYDKQTRVMYCISSAGYNRGNLYPLYNADGTLKLYD